VQERGELLAVQGQHPDGGGGGGITAGVGGLAPEDLLELRGDIRPRAHVLRLLLAPDQAGVAAVGVGDFGEAVAMQRVELLDADDRGIGDLVLLAVVEEVVVDLARAEDDAVDFVGFDNRFAVFRVGNDPLEVRLFCEVFDIGAGNWVSEQGFREEDNESWIKSQLKVST